MTQSKRVAVIGRPAAFLAEAIAKADVIIDIVTRHLASRPHEGANVVIDTNGTLVGPYGVTVIPPKNMKLAVQSEEGNMYLRLKDLATNQYVNSNKHLLGSTLELRPLSYYALYHMVKKSRQSDAARWTFIHQ